MPQLMNAATAHSRLSYLLVHVVGVTLFLAGLAWWVHASDFDFDLAGYFYDSTLGDFPFRTLRWLEVLGHRVLLALPVGMALVALAVALLSYRIAAWRSVRGIAWATVLTCAVGQVAINQLKHMTALPRPSDLSLFGGYAALPSTWWAATRAQAGGALPSGHAGAGFAMCVLYFVGWASGHPMWRWGGLVLGMGAGLVFSLVRIMQGAHFASQTLWSGALMWFLASVFFFPVITGRRPSDAVQSGAGQQRNDAYPQQ